MLEVPFLKSNNKIKGQTYTIITVLYLNVSIKITMENYMPVIWNNILGLNKDRSRPRLYIVTLLIELICRVHHEKPSAA